MEILAHRGVWSTPEEKNNVDALVKAITMGYGIETDIRDYCGKLVISHDVANGNAPLFTEFLQRIRAVDMARTLALNIKSDGLQELIKDALSEFELEDYFLFDMSIPELVVNERKGLKFYTRHSDIESHCVMYDKAAGVWMDSFYDNAWLKEEYIIKHIRNGKSVAIISPEIHGFEYMGAWQMIKQANEKVGGDIKLCTDMPNKAKEYFEL